MGTLCVKLHTVRFITHCVKLHTMCKIIYYVWNKIIQGSLSRSLWKKFLSLEKFYTHIVADVADYYEVWSNVCKQNYMQLKSTAMLPLSLSFALAKCRHDSQ